MTINDSVLQSGEKIIFALRELYLQQGYTPYRMSKFEEYDLYARNKDFLVSDQVITFTDVNGRLMALKPDVTLSIIKNSKDQPNGLQKLFYNENVYRVAKGANGFKEIMQAGLECIGRVDAGSIAEVIALAVKSLCTVSPDCVLELSNLSILEEAVGQLGLPEEAKPSLYQAVSEKNLHGVKALCAGAETEAVERLLQLVSIRGRKTEKREGSYTTYLFEKGLDKILKKVGEKSTEVIIAGKAEDKRETVYEIADLAYHVMVLMVEMGISLEDIHKELASRHVIDKKVKQEKMT